MAREHDALIRAALDGKTIQIKFGPDHDWRDYEKRQAIAWMVREDSFYYEFRIKPEVLVRYIGLWRDGKHVYSTIPLTSPGNRQSSSISYIWTRLDINPDTLEIISAERN